MTALAGTMQLDFGAALAGIKAGRRATRFGWNGVGTFVFLVPGSTFAVNREPLQSLLGCGTQVDYRPHIDMKDAQGMVGPWVPSGTDLMAEDWYFL